MKRFLNNLPKINSLEHIFMSIAIFFVVNFWLSTVLVTFSIFSIYPFIILSIVSFLLLFLFIEYKKFSVDHVDIHAFGVLLIFSILTFLFFHHSLYGVRDDGVYANAGIGIITRGSIYITDFINFPGWVEHGFFYTPQFPFGTSSWIALYYALFGLNGIHAFNILPIFVGGLSFYYLAKDYIEEYAIYALICLVTTYPIIWFSRRTISEIIFFSLLWFSFYLLKKIFFSPSWWYSLLLLLTCGSYLLVRGEGILYFVFTFIIFMGICIWQKNTKFLISIPGFIFFIPFIYFSSVVSNDYFLLLLHYAAKIISKFIPGVHFAMKTLPQGENQILHDPNSLYYSIIPYFLTVFTKYNYLYFIISVLLAAIHSLFNIKKSRYNGILLIIILLNLPTFYSLFDFTIAPDQPWFLRRYTFSIIPLAYFCGIILIHKYIKGIDAKKFIYLLLIAINVAISWPIIFYQDYKEVPKQIDSVAKHYSKNDIIFVDQYSAGWYRLATEMYFREGLKTYYITPNFKGNNLFSEFSQQLPLRSRNIYILTSKHSDIEGELKKHEEIFAPDKSFSFTYTSIVPTTDLLHFENIPNFNILNFNYTYIEPQIMVPTESYKATYDLVSYKVVTNDKFVDSYKLE